MSGAVTYLDLISYLLNMLDLKALQKILDLNEQPLCSNLIQQKLACTEIAHFYYITTLIIGFLYSQSVTVS